MRSYRFLLCDVFTTERFGGNQLAVLPDATGLDKRAMQQIAREFNFSETTFVFPGDATHTRRVRIFTPAVEVPFAGHPNIGTAFALAKTGEFGTIDAPTTVVFAEAAGDVEIRIVPCDERYRCELRAPQTLTIGPAIDAGRAAVLLGLEPCDVVTTVHEPCVASVGLPFLLVELAGREALERASAEARAFAALRDEGIVPDVHLYTHCDDGYDLRARMFAPFDGVPEDPATGSANCALAGLLAARAGGGGSHAWRIAQGVEMGRPSTLEARAQRAEDGAVTVWIGGDSVFVGEGVLYIE